MDRPAKHPAVLTGVGVVETTAPLRSFDFSTAARWELLVLHRGEPAGRLAFPSPGAIDSPALAHALIWPHVEPHRRRHELDRRLRTRLGAPADRPVEPPPSCSVVLCTHGRPAHLPTALAGLAALDPAPLEVIVVDNAPGSDDCRETVLAHGFRYVREDRKGLDNARNAGVRAARGEVIAFTDDDCVHPSGWLDQLGEAFADPLVAALTGPAFAYRLDTPARVRMERQASLTRGLRRSSFDWTLSSPLHAGQVGVGANMTVRASLLRAVAEPFPPELDAGTETLSGGDTYLFARLLAAGHRIVYDPRAFVFHQHRDDWPALEHAVRGYGTGTAALLWKLLLEDGELEALGAWRWLLDQHTRAWRRRLVGRADAVETRIAWWYVRGALGGLRAWRRALATQRQIDPALRPSPPFPPPTAPSPGAAAPMKEVTNGTQVADDAAAAEVTNTAQIANAAGNAAATEVTAIGGDCAVTVVVPTVGRAAVLDRCLAALAAQTLPRDAFEVIVVDDSPAGGVEPPARDGLDVRLHRSGGRGAAIARNEGAALARGELLLFLDDDLIAAPDLLAHHLARHARLPASPAVVVGCSPPRPPTPGLAALGAALWWEDRFRTLRDAIALTFTDALSGNVSIARAAFLDGRGFDPRFSTLRREDWEWGLRLLEDGVQLVYEPDAVAAHEYELSAGARLRACRLEGGGDALLVARHPEAAPFLPLADHRPPSWRHPLHRLLSLALGDPRADRLTLPLLDLLERGRLRSLWSSLYRRAQRASYGHGLRAAGWRPAATTPDAPILDVELTATDPLPRPGAVAPRLRVTAHGRELAQLTPAEGWHPLLAEHVSREFGHLVELEEDSEPPAEPELRLPVTVLLGSGDDRERAALEQAGARVVLVDRSAADGGGGAGAGVEIDDDYWSALLAAARAAEAELIALPAPGLAPDSPWLQEVEVAFEAPRVLMALGQALPDSAPAEPVTLHDRGRGRLPYAPLGGPADYLVLRREALPHLERALAHAAHGHEAVALACAERVLAAGSLVAHRNAHGLDRSDPARELRSERERAKLAAWGALLAEHALAQPRRRGVPWLAAVTGGALALDVRRSLNGQRPSGVPTKATTPALLAGYAAAIRGRDRSERG